MIVVELDKAELELLIDALKTYESETDTTSDIVQVQLGKDIRGLVLKLFRCYNESF